MEPAITGAIVASGVFVATFFGRVAVLTHRARPVARHRAGWLLSPDPMEPASPPQPVTVAPSSPHGAELPSWLDTTYELQKAVMRHPAPLVAMALASCGTTHPPTLLEWLQRGRAMPICHRCGKSGLILINGLCRACNRAEDEEYGD